MPSCEIILNDFLEISFFSKILLINVNIAKASTIVVGRRFPCKYPYGFVFFIEIYAVPSIVNINEHIAKM